MARKLAWHETPFQARRKTRAPATAQTRFLHRGDHLVLAEALAPILAQNFAQGLVSTARLIGLQAPIASVQTRHDLRMDMAAMERRFLTRCLKLG